MEWPPNPLDFNLSLTTKEITAFINNKFNNLNRRKAIIGLSGGLDSSLTSLLAAKALGNDSIQLLYIPERDSKPIHRQHALLLAGHLNIDLKIVKISPALRKLGVYRLLPLSLIPGRRLKARLIGFGKKEFLSATGGEFLSIRLNASGGSWVAKANAYACAKHRIRSVVLYKEAERSRGLVIGAANKTEWMTGTFTQWGCDHCADLMPLLHLYRSQCLLLAEYLGMPQEILEKKADPDILPGLDDKGELLGSFEIADQILWALEKGFSLNDLAERFGSKQVDYIQLLVDNSAYYRETPYSLL
jgi:NAD+ synthase